MPYYAWQGVDIAGAHRSGKRFASTVAELDELLFSQEIALIRARQQRVFFARSVSVESISHFFSHAARLLGAGLQFRQVLRISVQHFNGHLRLQEIIQHMLLQVNTGSSLVQACAAFGTVFDPITLSLLAVGQAGALAPALQAIAHRLQMKHDFVKKVRAALLMPLVTSIFFMLCSAFLFVFVVPSFEHLFATAKHIPFLTRALFALSAWLRSSACLWAAGAMLLIVLLCAWALRTNSGQKMQDTLCLKMPIVNTLIYGMHEIFFVQALSCLLSEGVPLVQAISISARVANNSILAKQFEHLVQDVCQGMALSRAMSIRAALFSPETIALASVGEQTGDMAGALSQACEIKKQESLRTLATYSALMQPALMLILGLLVALLVSALYLPLFSLSHVY